MKRLYILILSAFILLGITACDSDSSEPYDRQGLFSWRRTVFLDGGDALFTFMQAHGFNEVYQWFARDLTEQQVMDFLMAANEKGIHVYYLTGDPNWARDPEARQLIRGINRVVGFNDLLDCGSGIRGVLLNVEPHALSEWNNRTSRRELMDNFVAGSRLAYDEAAYHGLEVILCIPNWYDVSGFMDDLRILFSTSADRIAVMNYARGDEFNRIRVEVSLAMEYGRGIIQIYEFNPPGHHGITEPITYYFAGFEAALENFAELQEAFPESGITMAAHDFEVLRRIITPAYSPDTY